MRATRSRDGRRREQPERVLEQRPLVAQPRVQRLQDSQLAQRSQRRDRVRFAERESQLGTDSRARDGVQRPPRERRAGQFGGAGLDLEPKPGAIASDPQQTGGIVAEAPLVQHAQPAGLEIAQCIRHRAHLPPARAAQADGDRVDGEVPALEVLLLGPRAHVGQGSRRRVGLGAAGRDVDPPAVPLHERRAEALVLVGARRHAEAGGEIARERRGGLREGLPLAAHHDVQLARLATQQQIAHRAPDELHVVALPGHLEQRRAAGETVQPLEHDPWRAHRHLPFPKTAMPAAG